MSNCGIQDCENRKEIICSCNAKFNFCNLHFYEHQFSSKKIKHEPIFIQAELAIAIKSARTRISDLHRIRKQIIQKSFTMINAIHNETHCLLKELTYHESIIRKEIENQNLEKLKQIQIIEIIGDELMIFKDILRNYLNLKINQKVLNISNLQIKESLKKTEVAQSIIRVKGLKHNINEKSENKSIKYILVGDSDAGKSCLLLDPQYLNEACLPTIGINFRSKTIHFENIELKLNI